MTTDDRTSSSYELKKRLLRKARDGRSKFTVPEMIRFIDGMYRNKQVPPEHKPVIEAIREVEQDEAETLRTLKTFGVSDADLPSPSRALRRLNIEEKLRGLDGGWRHSVFIPNLIVPETQTVN